MTFQSTRGLAITPGVPRSVHLTTIDLPDLGPSDVRIRSRLVGICGTDRELAEGVFGSAPPGETELVLGHELLGEIEEVGPGVTGLAVGELVTATVRRGCGCRPCAAGAPDFCETFRYTERGIRGRHGFLTERLVEAADNVVLVPTALGDIGVLIEPLTCGEKAWRVALATQSRIATWEARTAVVYGAGPIGLLQTLMLRARGVEVYTLARTPAPNRAAEIVERAGATYISTRERPPESLKEEIANVDLLVECTGSAEAVEKVLWLVGTNGVLVLLSGTGRTVMAEIPISRLNSQFVGGNKTMAGSVNSSRDDFRAAIADLERFEELWPGLAGSLITKRIAGLDGAVDFLESTKGDIKAVVEVQPALTTTRTGCCGAGSGAGSGRCR